MTIRRRLQDRTCTTGIVAPGLVARWAAGGHVGRASGRDFDARRDLAYPPYAGMPFDVPVLTAGDVDARVRVRIREVEAEHRIAARLARGAAARADLRCRCRSSRGPREGIAIVEAFRGDLLVWLRVERRPDRALPRARRVVVPVAAAGGGDREQHRR